MARTKKAARWRASGNTVGTAANLCWRSLGGTLRHGRVVQCVLVGRPLGASPETYKSPRGAGFVTLMRSNPLYHGCQAGKFSTSRDVRCGQCRCSGHTRSSFERSFTRCFIRQRRSQYGASHVLSGSGEVHSIAATYSARSTLCAPRIIPAPRFAPYAAFYSTVNATSIAS